MSKEKQIEEMAKILCGMKNGCDGCMFSKVNCNERNYAEEIYNADYRKRSEWISVDERLPEIFTTVIVYDTHTQSVRFTLYNGKTEGWSNGRITHWMPLPEAPKGGAE